MAFTDASRRPKIGVLAIIFSYFAIHQIARPALSCSLITGLNVSTIATGIALVRSISSAIGGARLACMKPGQKNYPDQSGRWAASNIERPGDRLRNTSYWEHLKVRTNVTSEATMLHVYLHREPHSSGPFDMQLVYEDMPQESGSYQCRAAHISANG
jgi:hypothetical protein